MAVQRGDPGKYLAEPFTASVRNLLLEGCPAAWKPYMIPVVMTAQGMTVSGMIEKIGRLGELPGLDKPSNLPRNEVPKTRQEEKGDPGERTRLFHQLLQEGVPKRDIDGQPISVLRRMAKEKRGKVRSVTALGSMEEGNGGSPPGLDKMIYPWRELDKGVAQFHPKAE